MTLVKHELRQGKTSFLIWTASVSAVLAVCIFLFPEMKGQAAGMGEAFASMGSFTAAFGMDRLNFGTFSGFYAVECGNVLGLGGAFYACLGGAGMLGREERDGTADFLLTHPVGRARVVTEKLAALLLLITAMNAAVFAVCAGSAAAVGEAASWRETGLLHLAYYLLEIELACVCFGISAFIRGGGAGVGIGVAAAMYFLNLVANIADSAEFLKYITPYGYCDGADILSNGCIDGWRAALGAALGLCGVAAAYLKYTTKDIR